MANLEVTKDFLYIEGDDAYDYKIVKTKEGLQLETIFKKEDTDLMEDVKEVEPNENENDNDLFVW